MMIDLGHADTTSHPAGQPDPFSAVHRFSHQAMATVFEVFCVHPDREYARQAAWAAFDLVDRLEQDLSRFIENSDVSRINSLTGGESVRVSRWTMECLLISRLAYIETSRAFDISLGSGLDGLELSSRNLLVHANASAIRLDLGGIGKGYAVDRAADVLLDWGVNEAFIHGGCSSVLALDPPSGSDGWPLTMSRFDGAEYDAFALMRARRRVFSASGLRRREHIFDARSKQPRRLRAAAWASAEVDALAGFCRKAPKFGGIDGPVSESPAAVTEAFSTAFMMLSPSEIENCCLGYPGLEAWLIDTGPNDTGETPYVMHLP